MEKKIRKRRKKKKQKEEKTEKYFQITNITNENILFKTKNKNKTSLHLQSSILIFKNLNSLRLQFNYYILKSQQ